MNEHHKANQNLWEEYTEIHKTSEMYAVEVFKQGGGKLHDLELKELGSEVAGKTMLHLQCHFGQDSLMWAREGAEVTGVDFSHKAIALAQELNEELDLNCTFIQSNVLELIGKIDQQFDIVYTSYGVLTWLSDLKKWGEVVNHYLKPGGIFYIAEFHPASMMLNNEIDEMALAYPYFSGDAPLKFDTDGSYADPTAKIKQPVQYEWPYTMGDVINNLTRHGLHIEYLHEFDYSVYQQLPYRKSVV